MLPLFPSFASKQALNTAPWEATAFCSNMQEIIKWFALEHQLSNHDISDVLDCLASNERQVVSIIDSIDSNITNTTEQRQQAGSQNV